MLRKIPILLFAVLLLSFGGTAQTNVDGSFEHDGSTRLYRVYLPSAYTEGANLPVVINMHGFGSTSLEQVVYTNFNSVADAEGVIVVYPQGLVGTTTWGDTDTSWEAYFGTGADDLGFLDRLIDQLYLDYDIDLSRVYATGMSNGGFMSYRLACELSDRIAAVASVTGAMAFQQLDNCDPGRAMPVLEIHGTSDNVVPYAGIPLFTPSIPTVVDFWVDYNDCDPIAEEIEVPNIVVNDNTTTTAQRFDCAENSQVWFYTVANGGHSWPGAVPFPGLGNTSQDFSASLLIWEFFSQHTHPNPREVTVLSTTQVSAVNEWATVAPNPFADQLRIQLKSDLIEEARLLDLLGREFWVEQRPIGEDVWTVSTRDLPKGTYFLQFRTADRALVVKVIKA